MPGLRLVFLLLVFWIVLQAGSYLVTSGVEGPRNIETGFRRLDILFKWQITAFAVAVVAALAAFVGPDKGRRKRLIGLTPLALTIATIGGLIVAALVVQKGEVPNTVRHPTTAPAETVID